MPKRIIEVVPYNAEWPNLFAQESERIRKVLGSEIVQIHHIGSTSVPHLQAKPVIDIMLEVNQIDNLDAYNSQMEAIDYIPKGEFGISGRRLYIKGLYLRTHHIHAFAIDSEHLARHLAFRDYLRVHHEIAREYGELKAQCARECDNDNQRYCDGKNDFIVFHEKQALLWWEKQRRK